MIKGSFPIQKFENIQTPFYFYDTELLNKTLACIKQESGKYNYKIHYAIKANANETILDIIKQEGLGVDCVSGGEIKAALKAGFHSNGIVFAGVGKADWEIELALNADIFCFNVESTAELEIIDQIAKRLNKTAKVALRINPNVDAHTHSYITTGLNENKFGINLEQLQETIQLINRLDNISLIGLHFHIGSQITDMSPFQDLCIKIIPMADFETYFKVFHEYLHLESWQTLHFELGRSVVAPCGSLITKVLYIKEGTTKRFAIVDAGMTDLIRPALYGAYHHIENISSDKDFEKYDIVGPICESSDTFAKDYFLNETHRGDLLAIRSAGAYGEIMASKYNLRELPKSFFL